MTITSFYYFAFLAGCAIVYYLLPRKMQWIELLIFSVFFYLCAAEPYTLIYIVVSTLLAYGATCYIQHVRAADSGRGGMATAFTIAAVIINAIFWLVINGYGLLAAATGIIHRICPLLPVFQPLPLISALGMGYYTLQIIGYILDCYWEITFPQKNFLKLFLFVCFFPQLTVGPVSRYEQLGKELYVEHTFLYKNIAFGSQRILWGLLKVLVVSGRLAVIVNSVWEASDSIGFLPWIAMLLYPLQLYLDFSGSMDIVLGSAEVFGIRLEENFNNPFFAGSVREFWQRWHITLGTWAKDYVLYPVLHTALFKKVSDICIKKLGKNRGKFISTQLGMLILWTFIGCWHGRVRYIFGVTLWYWFLLFLGDLFLPITKKMNTILEIKTESFGWKFFKAVRTYLLFSIGEVSFRAANLEEGLFFLRRLPSIFTKSGFNPWLFFDGSITELGLGWGDINIIIIAVIMLAAVGYLRQTHGYARIWIAGQSVGFRWMIWIFLILIVLIYGQYGPGYDAVEFIYQDF